MINFRFHIVSLTAVFLAFAVGLVLGTTFLDDATERQLNRQLDDLDNDLAAAQRNNTQLQGQLDQFEDEGEALDAQLGERVLRDTLTDDPVLVVAPHGLEGEVVERVVEALQVSGADYVGAWRLTDRLVLDDDGEVSDLANALGLPEDADADRSRTTLSARLASALFVAIHAADVDQDMSTIAALHDEGFLDYELPEGSDSDVVVLPPSGLRVVVVTGAGAVVPNDQVLLPTLADLVSDDTAPVVVVAPTATDEDDPNNVDGIDSLVAEVRDQDDLSERISTVDDLETTSGRLSTILALQQAEPTDPLIGHYGLGAGADELMPAVLAPEEGDGGEAEEP
ncbi:MAG: copper transporter [Acidimicrobiales bacterium]